MITVQILDEKAVDVLYNFDFKVGKCNYSRTLNAVNWMFCCLLHLRQV